MELRAERQSPAKGIEQITDAHKPNGVNVHSQHELWQGSAPRSRWFGRGPLRVPAPGSPEGSPTEHCGTPERSGVGAECRFANTLRLFRARTGALAGEQSRKRPLIRRRPSATFSPRRRKSVSLPPSSDPSADGPPSSATADLRPLGEGRAFLCPPHPIRRLTDHPLPPRRIFDPQGGEGRIFGCAASSSASLPDCWGLRYRESDGPIKSHQNSDRSGSQNRTFAKLNLRPRGKLAAGLSRNFAM